MLGFISTYFTRDETISCTQAHGDRRYALELRRESPFASGFGQARPESSFLVSRFGHWKNKRPWMSTKPQKRSFHDYFVTHLPSSSLHPDSGSIHGRPHHKLPRSSSVPHTSGNDRPPSAMHQGLGLSREMTVVRIPLQSAKFHFGSSTARGTRPYNEDMFQAGVIEIPAFAKRSPISLK